MTGWLSALPFVPGYLRGDSFRMGMRCQRASFHVFPGWTASSSAQETDLIPGTGAKAACVGHQVDADVAPSSPVLSGEQCLEDVWVSPWALPC